MKKLSYILFLLLAKSTLTYAISIVAMEKTTLSADGKGYTRKSITYNSSFKYPIQQSSEIYAIDSSGTKTNLIKRKRFIGDHIIIKLKDGASRLELEKLNSKQGAFVRRKLFSKNTFLVAISNVQIDAVNNLASQYSAATNIIKYAEPDYMVELQDTNPNDHYYTNGVMWSRSKIECAKAWDLCTGTGGVIVAIIDSGIEYTHPDLAANIWTNPGETGIDSNGVGMATNGIDDDANGFIDDIHGWNFCNNGNNDPMDDFYHGTRCAGEVGAVGNNVIGIVGVGWNIRLMAMKFIDSAGHGTVSDAIECFDYVTMMRQKGINVRITSNSWTDDNYSSALEDAVKDNRDLGILCIAAAGNKTENIDVNPVYPACFDLDNVVCVTGTDINDELYTNIVGVGAVNVDLAAPARNVYLTNIGGHYGISSGTSYATPIVAGTAALIWEKAPHLKYQDVFKAIMDGVDPIASMQGKSVSGGRLNVYKALRHIPYGGLISIK